MRKYFNFILFVFVMNFHPKLLSLDYGILVEKISQECSNEVSKKYKLQGGLIGGSYAYDVRQIAIDFRYSGEVTIPEARRLFVEVAEVFIKKYNNNKEIRPYLRDYPFNLHHLGLSISFTDKPYHKEDMVSAMWAGALDIVYWGRIQNNKTQEIFRESYADALKIVREEKAQVAIKGQKS